MAICAVTALGACASPEIASRMDTHDMMYSGFDGSDTAARAPYGPEVAGARADNDFMRFSTLSMTR
jgi:hypothetical protein